jgi:3-oxoacyl-[acyl-carrier-protein] synthase-3
MIQVGSVQNALVIGSELTSRALDWSDRKTCILFGDGAGAAVVSRSARPGPLPQFILGSDGSGGPLLYMSSGGAPEPGCAGRRTIRGVQMNGPETFKFGVRVMVEVSEDILRQAGMDIDALDWLVPHQANQRIISAAAKRLGIPDQRVMSNIEEYGNTTAASIPIALAEWSARGQLRPGQTVLAIGFGAGLTWAAGLLAWQD